MNNRAKIITEQALSLPREEQEALYHALAESLGLTGASIEEVWLDEPEPVASYRLSQVEEEAVAEGQAQARRGEFVSDEEVAAFYKHHGVLGPLHAASDWRFGPHFQRYH
jgi:hypothetical protein